ncbi:MAG: hypothetical protein M1480_19830 [Bacteroidetes bacterium]|nr:hypothetical protein [Bacteroidota bacterium]
MNQKKLLPPLVCGFGAAVLTTVPGIKNIACCLIVPLAAVLSLYLDHKINRTDLPINAKSAIWFGIITGLFATLFSTFFDLLMTYIVHSNDFVQALPQTEMIIRHYKLNAILDQTMTLLKQMSYDITTYGFSTFYAFGILFSNLVINTIFGLLGGLLGMTFINKRTQI